MPKTISVAAWDCQSYSAGWRCHHRCGHRQWKNTVLCTPTTHRWNRYGHSCLSTHRSYGRPGQIANSIELKAYADVTTTGWECRSLNCTYLCWDTCFCRSWKSVQGEFRAHSKLNRQITKAHRGVNRTFLQGNSAKLLSHLRSQFLHHL